MVGIRILSVFIFGILLFTPPVCALMPSEKEKIELSGDSETIPSEIIEEIDEIKSEKMSIMEDIAPVREERDINLHPFVYDTKSADSEAAATRAPHIVKGFAPGSSKKDIVAAGQPSSKGPSFHPIANVIFFTVLALGFLAAYFFIRPRSK